MNLNELDIDKLDQEERDLLESFEKGEWESVGTPERFEQIRRAAHATLAKEKQVTLKL